MVVRSTFQWMFIYMFCLFLPLAQFEQYLGGTICEGLVAQELAGVCVCVCVCVCVQFCFCS